MNPLIIYSIVYALAARDGREEALFGQCAPFARQAFERSLAADAFPLPNPNCLHPGRFIVLLQKEVADVLH